MPSPMTGPCCPQLTVMPTPGLRQGQVSCIENPISRLFFSSLFTCLAVTLPKRERVRRGLEHRGLPAGLSVTQGAVPPQQQLHPAVCQAEEAAQCGQTHQAVPKKCPRLGVPQHDGAGGDAWGAWRAPPQRHFSARSRQPGEELRVLVGCHKDRQDGRFGVGRDLTSSCWCCSCSQLSSARAHRGPGSARTHPHALAGTGGKVFH